MLMLARDGGAIIAPVQRPMTDLDIWRTGRLMMEQHGPRAIERACDRIHELCAVGDIEGCKVWSRVVAAINEIGRTVRREGETVN